MKTIKWLISLVNIKPILFSIAILLIAIASLTAVIIERNEKVNQCEHDKINLKIDCDRKADSLYRIVQMNEAEIKGMLRAVIDEYKARLEEQKRLNNEVQQTIDKNKTILNKNN